MKKVHAIGEASVQTDIGRASVLRLASAEMGDSVPNVQLASRSGETIYEVGGWLGRSTEEWRALCTHLPREGTRMNHWLLFEPTRATVANSLF